jgi:uncharacterized protein YyaL (SSP411 family)
VVDEMARDRVRWLAGRMLLAAGAVVGGALCATAEAQQAATTNRLAGASSPYLLQHAANPVDWYEWGGEALARARQENKPVFISIGYSTCFWCHVAERTVYADPAIAALMNRWFVNIKVDREERPDLDQTFMLARELLTKTSGWPNNVFLTPDLKPFFAGSYFPPDDQPGATGFPTILRLVHENWESNPDKINAVGAQVQAALSRATDTGGKPASVSKIVPMNWLASARDQILKQRDRTYGGLDGGVATKFARSPKLELLLADYRLNGTNESLQAMGETLDAIALGGVHDHLGGGLHRYSIEATWSVPHFEKMLYLNAELVGLYADYYALTGQPLARALTIDLAGYLTRRMSAPGGGFYTAEDAESEGVEGASYLWTRAEITAVLGSADAGRFFDLYELKPLPGDAKGAGVLRVRRDQFAAGAVAPNLSARIAALAPARARLLAARDDRVQPARDEKIVVSLNGLAIAGLARAGQIIGEPRWIESARMAGEFVWLNAFDEGTGNLRHHVFRGEPAGDGFLDDYAMLGLGYLALAEATGEPVWRLRALALASALVDRFVGPDGLVVNSLADANAGLPLLTIDLYDDEAASPTSAAYALLTQLGKTEPQHARTALKILARMADKVAAAPAGWASFTAYAALSGQTAEVNSVALDSAAHVRAAARGASHPDRDEITVTLVIDPGYHVNANPASADYLIPTVVIVPGAPDAEMSYPAGLAFKPRFSPEGISVYEGSVQINARLPKGGLASIAGTPLRIEVQACTEQICLPPATFTTSVSP